jgi:hypothetical protein
MLTAAEFLRPLKPLYDAPRAAPRKSRGGCWPAVFECFKSHPEGLYVERVEALTGVPRKKITWAIADHRAMFEVVGQRGLAKKMALIK